jgi:hypothetical protein
MWDDGTYLPGEAAPTTTTTPEVLSPGAGTDWTQVLIQGLSTYGNVRIAESRAQAQNPLGVRTMMPGGVQANAQGVAIGTSTLALLALGAVVVVLLMRD